MTMKLSLIAGFGKCDMSKCLNSDEQNIVLTEEESHSKNKEGLISNKIPNCSNIEDMRDNTHTKTFSHSQLVCKAYLECDGPATNARWGIPKGLGLLGGGENSLNTNTSEWGGNSSGPPQSQWVANQPMPNPVQQQGTDFGSLPNQNGTQQSQQQGGSNSQQPSSSQVSNQPGNSLPNTSWAQAAGKGLPNSNQNQNTAQSSATKQLEQLNTMREALFSQDGWGGQHVNQDNNWETGFPEKGAKTDSAGSTAGATSMTTPTLKPNVNNGTDLWEANKFQVIVQR